MKGVFNKAKSVAKKALRQIKSLKLFQNYYFHILNGRKIYLKLTDKYGENCRIYINHYPGTGDVYITSALLPAWAKKQGVNRYVVTVIGKSAYNVVKLFPIENVELLSERETEDLLHYLQTIGETGPNMEVLHFTPFAFQSPIILPLLGVNGSNFMDMYMNVTFPGLTMQDMLEYDDQTSDEEIAAFFREKGLIPGRTVVLVPYANTIDPLSDQFWNYLAAGLMRKGYTVCTNCDYPKEKKIMGTIPVFLKYRQMNKFVETAGTIIQLRSGLTDLLSHCHCKNIVLYPVENHFRFGAATLYEYFSIEKMQFTNSVTEIEFARINSPQICTRIIDSF